MNLIHPTYPMFHLNPTGTGECPDCCGFGEAMCLENCNIPCRLSATIDAITYASDAAGPTPTGTGDPCGCLVGLESTDLCNNPDVPNGANEWAFKFAGAESCLSILGLPLDLWAVVQCGGANPPRRLRVFYTAPFSPSTAYTDSAPFSAFNSGQEGTALEEFFLPEGLQDTGTGVCNTPFELIVDSLIGFTGSGLSKIYTCFHDSSNPLESYTAIPCAGGLFICRIRLHIIKV